MSAPSRPPSFRYPDAGIAVFTRAPVEGQVKTRLIPALGADATTRLFRLLLERLLDGLYGAAIAPLEILSTEPAHPFFDPYRSVPGIRLEAQQGEGLGERLGHVFAQGLRHHRSLLVLGSDIPDLSHTVLVEALEALRSGIPAVLMPAEDGGYGLVGLTRPEPRLFAGIDWGSDRVMAQTRARLRELGWAWQELPCCWDLDEPQDLERLRAVPDLPLSVRALLEQSAG